MRTSATLSGSRKMPTRPVGRPSHKPVVRYKSFHHRFGSNETAMAESDRLQLGMRAAVGAEEDPELVADQSATAGEDPRLVTHARCCG